MKKYSPVLDCEIRFRTQCQYGRKKWTTYEYQVSKKLLTFIESGVSDYLRHSFDDINEEGEWIKRAFPSGGVS